MSMYGIFDKPTDAPDRARIGTVMKFVGNKPSERWVAYADDDLKQGFPTLRAASE